MVLVFLVGSGGNTPCRNEREVVVAMGWCWVEIISLDLKQARAGLKHMYSTRLGTQAP